MSTMTLLALLSPLLLLVIVGGVVAVVALVKADSKDVPEVARVWCSLFRKLAERTPKINAGRVDGEQQTELGGKEAV